MADGRSEVYCFTLNNFIEDDLEKLLTLDAQYVIAGKELAPETGTPHLQGYISFHTKKSLKQVKEIYPRAHWEIAKGDSLENYAYCSKGGDFIERGVRPLGKHEKRKARGDGAKALWEEVWSSAKEGRIEDISAEIRFKHYRTIKTISGDYLARPPDLEDGPCGIWIHGPAGVGKSRLARELDPDLYPKDDNEWWNGYSGQQTVLLDDFDPYTPSLTKKVKIWADRYSFLAQVKGGYIWIRPKKFIVTSQYTIEECFKDPKSVEAMNRRFEIISLPN